MLSSHAALRGIIPFFLLCCFSGIQAYAVTAVCDQKQTNKICLQLTSPSDKEVWLWFTPFCQDSCLLVSDELVSEFLFIEQLPTKEFGMQLQQTEPGDMYWTSYSLDKTQQPTPVIMSFPLTKVENLNLPARQIKPDLIKDLVRLRPNSDELMIRYQEIIERESWVKSVLTHSLAFLSSILLMYCCYQCGI